MLDHVPSYHQQHHSLADRFARTDDGTMQVAMELYCDKRE